MTTSQRIDVGVVDAPGTRLTGLVPEWDELARRCGQGFASRPSYALSWWEELGSGSLEIVTARRDGRLVAVAPLHRRTLLGQPVLRWLGHGLGTVGQLVAEDLVAAGAVWAALTAEGTPVQMTHVRLDDPATMALRRSGHSQVRLTVDERCPALPLPPGIRACDLRSARSLKRLAGYRSALIRQEGDFDVEIVSDVDDLDRRWPDISRLAADADRGRGRQNLCAPPFEGFTLHFLREEARAGALLVVGAVVSGRWVAHEIGLRTQRRLDLWLSRFDPRLDRFALGHLVTERMVDLHDDLGVDLLDMGIGENAYKQAWTTTAYDVGTLVTAPRRLELTLARVGAAQRVGELRRRVRRIVT